LLKFTTNQLIALCALVVILGGARAGAMPVVGGATTFNVDREIESLYDSLDIGTSLLPPAGGDLEKEPQILVLPITGGDTTTEIEHAGGVSVRAEGETVDITNIVIHFSGPDANKVTADLSSHGVTENLAVADISGLTELIIDPSFAAIVRSAGGPDVAGIPLATFNTRPEFASTATPESNEMCLMALGLIGVSTTTMKLRRNNM
jgi:hypothetical protein